MCLNVPRSAWTAPMVVIMVVLITLCVVQPAEEAAFYKCAGPNGRTTFTDRPCASGQVQGIAAPEPEEKPSGTISADAAEKPPSQASATQKAVQTARVPSGPMADGQNGPIRGKQCYGHNGGTNLVLGISHPAGTILGVQRQATSFTGWYDDVGTVYGSKKGGAAEPFRAGDQVVSWAGASLPSDQEYEVTFRVERQLSTNATQCQAEGMLAYRLGTDRQAGKTRPIRLQAGETFDLGGIPFEVDGVKPWPFKDQQGKQRMVATIHCLKGDFQSQDYDFIGTLKLYSDRGKLLDDKPNQKSIWSDAKGREGFMYNWILETSPAEISLAYELWRTIEVIQVPFKVSAPIKH